jgi:hypothetical protein
LFGNAKYRFQDELSSRPEESWAFGPPKAMKNVESGRLALAGNGKGSLRSG